MGGANMSVLRLIASLISMSILGEKSGLSVLVLRVVIMMPMVRSN